MRENVGNVKKVYQKPIAETLFMDVTSSIMEGSVGGDAGEAPDDGLLNAKQGEFLDEDY